MNDIERKRSEAIAKLKARIKREHAAKLTLNEAIEQGVSAYSEALQQRYWPTRTGCRFDDGITYTWAEIEKLKPIKDVGAGEALRKIHLLKKQFKGVVN